jgi:hypothetical protein
MGIHATRVLGLQRLEMSRVIESGDNEEVSTVTEGSSLSWSSCCTEV